jgi:glucose/arabinose dehydrogenase
MIHRALMAGAILALVPAWLAAQTPAAPPATRTPAPQTGQERDFPELKLTEGQPIESRPPEKADNAPLFPQQTRAPYHATAPYVVTTLTTGLKLPWSMAFLPNGRILITERIPGAMRLLDKDGALSAPLTGLAQLAAPGKLGLLDVVLAPDFARSRRVYFSFFETFAKGHGNTNIAHGVLDEATGAVKDVTVIFNAKPTLPMQNFSAKQGGRIVFAPDGTIFMTVGDRDGNTKADYDLEMAQKLDNHMGKIIHVTAEGRPAPNNPFLKRPDVLPEIWAYGIRSPQGLALDPRTGWLWETEHGPRGGDELNHIRPGVNYGWPIIAHGIDYSGVPMGAGITAKAGMEQPVYYWDPVIAPSGLAVYTGTLFPQWRNSILAGGLRGVMLDRLEIKNGKVVAEEPLLTELKMRIRDVRVGPEGAVYVLTDNGHLLKLKPK